MNVKLDGITLHVNPDENPPNPRTDYDNLGTLLAWNRRYNFSDKSDYPTSEDFYESEEAKNIYVSLPVYMYEHSGVCLSTSPFFTGVKSDPAYGKLGVIYCTEEQVKKWYGCLPDKNTIETQLNSEIETYNDYLNGSWYEFVIEGLNGEIEDSCGGFFQNEGFKELLDNMKEYVSDDYAPLFDKLARQQEYRACM